MSEVYVRLAHALAGQETPAKAKVILSYAQDRDVDGLVKYLKHLAEVI